MKARKVLFTVLKCVGGYLFAALCAWIVRDLSYPAIQAYGAAAGWAVVLPGAGGVLFGLIYGWIHGYRSVGEVHDLVLSLRSGRRLVGALLILASLASVTLTIVGLWKGGLPASIYQTVRNGMVILVGTILFFVTGVALFVTTPEDA